MIKRCEYKPDINLVEIRKKIVFSLLGIIVVINSSCNETHSINAPTTLAKLEPSSLATTEPPLPSATTIPDLPLTPSELQEFDDMMLELDPDQQLVTKITQRKLSTTVDITIGPGFKTLSQERQNEIAIAMRDGLGQVCSCIPYLKLNTEDGQRLSTLEQYLQWQ